MLNKKPLDYKNGRLTRYLSAVLLPIDWPLMLLVMLLLCCSYVLIYSASAQRIPMFEIHICIAMTLMVLCAHIRIRFFIASALPLYILSIFLLVSVALFGDISKGARRWLDLKVIRIQPSELLKISMPLMLVWFFSVRQQANKLATYLLSFILLGIPLLLILMQPDLGTAFLVAASGLFVIYFAGLSWKLIIPFAVIALILILFIVFEGDKFCASGVSWHFLHEYQKNRVCTFLDPTRDPLGKGFHIIQSTIAIGSGGVWGKGWMEGTQTHLSFIPERHTDFILSVLAEEFGLVGIILILVLYSLLIYRIISIAFNSSLFSSRLLAGTIAMILFIYVFVNMGMVSGILPVVGIPLPLISYGGTSLVSLCIGLGMTMSIANEQRLHEKRHHR